MYNNGPRKGMMYGGAARRKPMMYGGTANQMSAKRVKAQQMPREERKSKNVEPAMGMPKMAGGGKLKPPPNPGAAALPKKVRNKMGFMAEGGEALASELKDFMKNQEGKVPDELQSAYDVIMKGMGEQLSEKEQKKFDKYVESLLKKFEKKLKK